MTQARCLSEALNPHSQLIMTCVLFADHPAARHVDRNGAHSWDDECRTRCEHLDHEEMAS